MSTLLKFDGPRLEPLLEQVSRELGPDAVIVEANRLRRGGIAGFFAKEWFEVVVDDPSLAAGAPREAEQDPFLALADAVQDLAIAHVRSSSSPSAAGTSPPLSAGRAAPQVPPSPKEVGRVPAPRAKRLRDLDLEGMLVALGDLAVPRDLPDVAAPLIACAGELNLARRAAGRLAGRMGLQEADVVVATASEQEIPSWLRISDAEVALSRAVRWRRSELPVVVAVEVSPGREGHAWAAEVLASLAADQVRLVARAWQLADGLRAKSSALGGVDGIDLVELDVAAEPELFIEVGLPVLALDGRPASAELWAALLLERRCDERG